MCFCVRLFHFRLGSGKVEELKALISSLQATLVIFDDELTPAQGKNVELIVGTRAVSVSTGSGKSVTYTATDLGKLDAYIASLRVQLGQASGFGLPFVPTF